MVRSILWAKACMTLALPNLDTYSFNIKMGGCVRGRQWCRALALGMHFDGLGLKRSEVTWSELMAAWLVDGWRGACKLMESGWMDAVTQSMAISGQRQWQMGLVVADSIGAELREGSLQSDVVSYNAALACALKGSWQMMGSSYMQLNVVSYSTRTAGMARWRQWQRAFLELERLESQGLQQNLVAHSAAAASPWVHSISLLRSLKLGSTRVNTIMLGAVMAFQEWHRSLMLCGSLLQQGLKLSQAGLLGVRHVKKPWIRQRIPD